jgi:hypothetical protein
MLSSYQLLLWQHTRVLQLRVSVNSYYQTAQKLPPLELGEISA